MNSDALDLPDGWQEATLGEVTQLVRDRVQPSDVPQAIYLGLEHVEAHTMKLVGSGHSSEVKSTKTQFRAGDVLYGKLRPYLNKVAQPLFDGICSTDFLVLRSTDRVDAGFIANYLNQLWVADRAHQLSTGVELPRVGWQALSTFPIVFPVSKEEQRRLARVIETTRVLRSSTSSRLAAADAAIERLRQSILQAACSGQLTDDWREQRRQPDYGPNLPGTPRPIGAAIDTPEEWSWFRLGDLAELQGGIQVGATRRPDRPLRAVPYLRVANVQKGWLDLSEIKTIMAPEETIRLLRLQPGDMLFNEGGDRDKLGRGWIWEGQIAECIHQNHVFRGRLYDSRMQPRFYSWYGNTAGMAYFFSEGKQTVNLASLSKTKLSQLPVPVPGIEEQAEIVRRLERLLYLVDRLQGRVEVAARKLERSSQAVLAKALQSGVGAAI